MNETEQFKEIIELLKLQNKMIGHLGIVASRLVGLAYTVLVLFVIGFLIQLIF